jgi:acyl carrier protein
MPRGVAKRKDPAERPAIARGIPEKVVDLLLDTVGCDEDDITLDSKLYDDLGADSLDIVELQMACEEAFSLPHYSLDEAVNERWEVGTVADVLADLRKLGAKV